MPLQAAPSNPGVGGNLTPANHKVNSFQGITNKGNMRNTDKGVDINLPPNFFTPPSGQTVNADSGLVTVPNDGLVYTLMEYQVPDDAMFQITQFSCAGPSDPQVEYIPTVNGHRIWPNIGTQEGPSLYRIRGPKANVLAQTTLKPGDVFRWQAVNTSAIDQDMFGAVVGYLITNQGFEDTRFGG
jgi:hypothetical protein